VVVYIRVCPKAQRSVVQGIGAEQYCLGLRHLGVGPQPPHGRLGRRDDRPAAPAVLAGARMALAAAAGAVDSVTRGPGVLTGAHGATRR